MFASASGALVVAVVQAHPLPRRLWPRAAGVAAGASALTVYSLPPTSHRPKASRLAQAARLVRRALLVRLVVQAA